MIELGFAMFGLLKKETIVIREPEVFPVFKLDHLKQQKAEETAAKDGTIIPMDITALRRWKDQNTLNNIQPKATAKYGAANQNEVRLDVRKQVNG